MADSWEAIDRNSRGSITAVSTADNKTIVRLTADPITGALLVSSSGTGSFSQFVLAATGAVNGLNQTFVFTSAPYMIVSDGVWYMKLDSNGNTQWSGTTTVTMTIPPSTSIFGIS